VDRAEEIGGALEVVDRELEEDLLAVGAALREALDRLVVAPGRDRLVEDGRVRGQPGHRVVVDVRLELSRVE